ncbi:hypothetical protein [Pedobacter nyackensis]
MTFRREEFRVDIRSSTFIYTLINSVCKP